MPTILKRFLLSLIGFTLLFAVPSFAQEETAAPQIDAAIIDPNVELENLAIMMVPLTAAELVEAADGWQENVRSELSEIAKVNLAILDANDAQSDALRDQLITLTEEQTVLQKKYESVLVAWQAKGATAEELQPHYDYIRGIKASALQANDPIALVKSAGSWLTSSDGGLGVLLKIGGLIIAIWIMKFIAKFVRRLAGKGVDKIPNLSILLKSFMLTAVYWVTFAIGIMVVLAMFGVNVGPVFAILGGLSFVIAFALQDTLGNLASGLMIMILKPFDMGDFIRINGATGTVDEMTIVATKIRTIDNQVIVVPNSKIWGDVITNVNASETRRVDLVFGIGYGDSSEKAIGILTKLVESNKLILGDPEAEIFVGELADSSVNIFCRPWTKTDDYWTVYWGLLAEAKEQFDAEGISIPFPQRDVHIHQVTSDTTAGA